MKEFFLVILLIGNFLTFILFVENLGVHQAFLWLGVVSLFIIRHFVANHRVASHRVAGHGVDAAFCH